MDCNYLVKVDKKPYPHILLKRDEVTRVELMQLKSIIESDDMNDERISLLIWKGDILLCIGTITSAQVSIITSIFHNDIAGYLSETEVLQGEDEISLVLGS